MPQDPEKEHFCSGGGKITCHRCDHHKVYLVVTCFTIQDPEEWLNNYYFMPSQQFFFSYSMSFIWLLWYLPWNYLLEETSLQDPEYGHFWSCGAQIQWPSHDNDGHLLIKSNELAGFLVNAEWISWLLKPTCRRRIRFRNKYISTSLSSHN